MGELDFTTVSKKNVVQICFISQGQRELAAKYTREGEGHANEGWLINKDVVSNYIYIYIYLFIKYRVFRLIGGFFSSYKAGFSNFSCFPGFLSNYGPIFATWLLGVSSNRRFF